MSESPRHADQTTIETQLPQVFEELRVNPLDKTAIETFLDTLKQKDINTYEHSIRVGLLAKRIGKFMNLDEKSLFFAGLLHDLGKTEIPAEILKKTEGWTHEDMRTTKQHVIYGYEAIKGHFDFTAEIILLHHKFQENGYPENLPAQLHNYSPKTQALILEHAKVLALADTYDALHRENDKFSKKRRLSDTEIKEKMLELKFCKKELIENLYKTEIIHGVN
jgi:putative nucleotidyltransferase with HDIG domain